MQAKKKRPAEYRGPDRFSFFRLAALVCLGAGSLIMPGSCASIGAAAQEERLQRIKASPQYGEGRFVNPWTTRQPAFWAAMKKWIKGADHTKPCQPPPILRREKAEFESPPPSGLRITWLGHSTALVEIDGARVLLDPMWSQRSSPLSWLGPGRFFDPPLALEDLPPLDGVLISHDHYDHLDESTVRRLADSGTRFIVPLGLGALLEKWGVSRERIEELDWWQSAGLGPLTIVATPARHFSGRSMILADRNRTLWCGFAILGPGRRVYYSGDTGMFPGFEEICRRLGPFQAGLIEIGAYDELWADLHLGPEQAARAAAQVRSRLMIPVHWGTFDLALHSWTEPVERLLVAARETSLRTAIPRPGQSLEPANPPDQARWWPRVPWQRAEEHPVVSSGSGVSKSSLD